MLTRTRLAAAGALLVLVVAVTTAIAVVGHQGDPRVEVLFVLFSILGGTGLALTGLLLLGLRPGHGSGRCSTVTGMALVLEFALREIAFAGGAAGWVPTAVWLSLIGDVVWFPLGVALVLLLFPDGRPSSPRWAWVVRCVLALAAVRVLLACARRRPAGGGVAQPGAGVVRRSPAPPTIAGLLDLVSILVVPFAVASLVVRFRRSDAEGRQRLKPLGAGRAGDRRAGCWSSCCRDCTTVGVAVFVVGITVALPLALAVGALRYRVWDLDPVLVATLVYTGLAALVTGVYIAVVVVVSEIVGQQGRDAGSRPVGRGHRVWSRCCSARPSSTSRASARRLVYGVRSSPYAVLTALPHQLVEAPAVADVLPRTAETLARGLGVPAARVRAVLEDGTICSPGPRNRARPRTSLLVVPVRHAGEAVGDVAVSPSPDRPLGGPRPAPPRGPRSAGGTCDPRGAPGRRAARAAAPDRGPGRGAAGEPPPHRRPPR